MKITRRKLLGVSNYAVYHGMELIGSACMTGRWALPILSGLVSTASATLLLVPVICSGSGAFPVLSEKA